mmetsp:Transcript_41978/g.65589  ORF Transcript_41978/g.65589 Transcript_41978/m.65589 type:complete len:511 (+) Transcript_41978:116-1648(+)
MKRVLLSNFTITKGISDSLRTSLGPHGMDKMIINENGITITNDGVTILKSSKFEHPAAKLLVGVSRSQDETIGDGTTSIVVLSGSILACSLTLYSKGLNFHMVTKCLYFTLRKSKEVILQNAVVLNQNDYSIFLNLSWSALESKVVSVNSAVLGQIAATCALRITECQPKGYLNLENVKILKKIGKTLEESEILEGFCLEKSIVRSFGGPEKIEKAKIAYCQFDLTLPSSEEKGLYINKTYSSLDKILRIRKKYAQSIGRKIKGSGCNVMILQKSLIKENICEITMQILAQLQILLIKDVDREDGDRICQIFGCKPIADINSFSPRYLGTAISVEERKYFDEKIVFLKKLKNNNSNAISVILRGSNNLILNEAKRSLIDALSVIRTVTKKRFLVGGGGCLDIEMSVVMNQFSKSMTGSESFSIKALSSSFEIIPYTLAENAGLEPIKIISDLKKRHIKGEKNIGLDARKKILCNVFEENIISPLLVFSSILNMSIEFVVQMIKIDDVFQS